MQGTKNRERERETGIWSLKLNSHSKHLSDSVVYFLPWKIQTFTCLPLNLTSFYVILLLECYRNERMNHGSDGCTARWLYLCHRTVHLKMLKIGTFILHTFAHNKNKHFRKKWPIRLSLSEELRFEQGLDGETSRKKCGKVGIVVWVWGRAKVSFGLRADLGWSGCTHSWACW